MSRDITLTDPDGVRYSYERISTQNWLNGHVPGMEAAAGWLRERAVVLFRNGNDTAAVNLRKLADDMERELKPDMQKRIDDHYRDHPEVLDEADEPPARKKGKRS